MAAVFIKSGARPEDHGRTPFEQTLDMLASRSVPRTATISPVDAATVPTSRQGIDRSDLFQLHLTGRGAGIAAVMSRNADVPRTRVWRHSCRDPGPTSRSDSRLATTAARMTSPGKCCCGYTPMPNSPATVGRPLSSMIPARRSCSSPVNRASGSVPPMLWRHCLMRFGFKSLAEAASTGSQSCAPLSC